MCATHSISWAQTLTKTRQKAAASLARCGLPHLRGPHLAFPGGNDYFYGYLQPCPHQFSAIEGGLYGPATLGQCPISTSRGNTFSLATTSESRPYFCGLHPQHTSSDKSQAASK